MQLFPKKPFYKKGSPSAKVLGMSRVSRKSLETVSLESGEGQKSRKNKIRDIIEFQMGHMTHYDGS